MFEDFGVIDIIILGVIAAAMIFIAVSGLRHYRRGASGCMGCSGCCACCNKNEHHNKN